MEFQANDIMIMITLVHIVILTNAGASYRACPNASDIANIKDGRRQLHANYKYVFRMLF